MLLRRYLTAAVLLVVIGAPRRKNGAWAQANSGNAGQQARRDPQAELLMKITAPFTVAAVGDIYEPRQLVSDSTDFQKLIENIRKSDVGFANMESSLIDFQHFEGPVFGSLAPLDMGESMKAMGITMVNHANNHALDGGVAGMFSTDEQLDRLKIVHAGSGHNLQEARGAQYLETPKGRVGLVGMFSIDDSSNYGPKFEYWAATYRDGNLGGAPGVNPLHLTAYHVVSPEQLHTLAEVAGAVNGNRGGTPSAGNGAPERFKFFDEWYEAGSDPGALHYAINPADEKDNLQSIRNAKVYSDFVISSIHSHHTSTYKSLGYGGVDHAPPDFLVKLAHESIDSGADMFVAHGVHSLRGVEIYRGKPIFYGLSSFVFQFGLQLGPGYDVLGNEQAMSLLELPANQETVLTTSHFEGGRLTEVRLYPVELGGSHKPISQMGLPMTPTPEEAEGILKQLQEYSKPFGTIISIENNVGVIRVPTGNRGYE